MQFLQQARLGGSGEGEVMEREILQLLGVRPCPVVTQSSQGRVDVNGGVQEAGGASCQIPSHLIT